MFSLTGLVLLFVVILPGCNGGSEQKQAETTDDQASVRLTLAKQKRCRSNLHKALEMLRPSPKRVDSELQSVLVLLNQWFGTCAEISETKLDPNDGAFAEFADGAAVEQLNQPVASMTDIHYLRDQFLAREVARNVIQAEPTDLAKIRTVFDHVCRNISQDPNMIDPRLAGVFISPEVYQQITPQIIPRSLHDLVLAGRGTAEDRVWLMSTMLRQLQFSNYLYSSGGVTPAAPHQLLLIVPVDQELLVFCPGLGIELTSASGDPWKVEDFQGAGNEIRSRILFTDFQGEQLVADWLAADWSAGALLNPAPLMAISPRMEVVQLDLSGELACEVYVPPASAAEPLAEDALPVVKTAHQLRELASRFWAYPHLRYAMLGTGANEVEQMRTLFLASLMKEVQSVRATEDQNENKSYQMNLERQMMKGRMEQILGENKDALRVYTNIRLQTRVAGEDQQAAVENMMRYIQVEDAHYWSAISQLDNATYAAAANNLRDYAKRYPQGRWLRDVVELLAEAEYRDGHVEEAIRLLEESGDLLPQQKVRRIQKLKTWKAQ
ncbi:MAG: outer membrane protein assembly factor BamD [Planctomycetaceae bacterium]|nr:outer membrane protein assembly factor BamD [Planctomycetaceae bacterium]